MLAAVLAYLYDLLMHVVVTEKSDNLLEVRDQILEPRLLHVELNLLFRWFFRKILKSFLRTFDQLMRLYRILRLIDWPICFVEAIRGEGFNAFR